MRRAALRVLVVLAVTVVVAGLLPAAGAPAPAPAPVLIERLAVPGDVPTAAPLAFSLVGFAVPVAVREVRFRTSADGLRWSGWMEAEVLRPGDEGPDPGEEADGGDAPRMTEPVWVGEARWLHVAGGEVTAHLVDSVGLSLSPVRRLAAVLAAAWQGAGAAPGAASTSRPPIVGRRGWGADESLRRGSPRYADRLVAATLHHTAGSNGYTRAQAPAVVRAIYAYHTRSLGWDDLGYHFLVDRYGTIYEGRAGGVERAVIGAHAGGFNVRTFGVAVMGTFMSAPPTPAALDAVEALLAWKFSLHRIDPRGTVLLTSAGSTRYPRGTQVRLHTLFGHRDTSRTACPGDALYPLLPGIRRNVASRMDAGRLLPLPLPIP